MDISGELAYWLATSMAAERCVEFVKRIVPWLAVPAEDEKDNRLIALHSLSFSFGTIIAYVSQEVTFAHALVVGLAASGGSGLWHDVLGLVLEIKNSKRA